MLATLSADVTSPDFRWNTSRRFVASESPVEGISAPPELLPAALTPMSAANTSSHPTITNHRNRALKRPTRAARLVHRPDPNR